MQDLFRTARDLNVKPSELIGIFDEALGIHWPESEPQDIIIRAAGQRFDIPAGFKPLDDVVDSYEGKRLDGARWTIISEWSAPTNEFALTFWAHDDNSMTAAETREYTAALLEMSAYITTMGNIMAAGSEG
ncbi:hypothetical protein [Arthrobacter psychrochitiniphilus]|uniref:hypothetical protein n=1 Tax=Arthrobacter psychrochitiniphilus TaxID=291045 RepID=UPI003F7BDA6D